MISELGLILIVTSVIFLIIGSLELIVRRLLNRITKKEDKVDDFYGRYI